MLTNKQERIFNFIRGYIASNNFSPTMKEIGDHVGLTSSASVFDYLSALEKRGLITRVPNVSRGIRLVQESETCQV